ncbi:MAG TPA: SEC-C metal-binding domain-containing protein [Tepidisphaeraceae bacterium]|jgi:hypothetical protein
MLLPDQVIPFLAHEDKLLRNHACRYFEDAHDPSPLTADVLWQAIDKLEPAEPSSPLVHLLPRVPGSDDSTARLLGALALDDDRMADVEEDLWHAMRVLDIEQLVRHRDAAMARLEGTGMERVRAHLQDRLALAELPLDAVWDRLVALAGDTCDKYWYDLDHDHVARLTEALARHGDDVARRAIALAESPADQSGYADVFAIQILARMRHRPALDLLVRRFVEADPDDEVLNEELLAAVPRVGGADAVAALEPRLPAGGEDLRRYGSEMLWRIKRPEAEAAILRLIERPEVGDERDFFAGALGYLITTDGLPRLRRMVLEEDYDPRMFDLKHDLVACSLMTGFDFPELGALREEVVARELEFERRLAADNLGLADDDFEEEDELEDDLGYYPDLPPVLDDRHPAVTMPIQRTAPKVGRNDPCPCGSGKKYKKCCLDRQ